MIDLKTVINQYPDCVADGKKLKSVLLDLYPNEKLYGNLLVQMLDDGIADEIKNKKEIDAINFINMCTKIEKRHGIAQKYIEGCPTIWANAFDVSIKTKVEPIKRVRTSVPQSEATIHTHKYVDTIIPQTCAEKGYTLHVCGCGYEYKDNFVNARHDYVLVEYTDPTCETDGKELYKCMRCGNEKTEIVKAKGHKFSKWVEQEKPLCETDGYEIRQCSVCGKIEKRVINATGHNFSEWYNDGENLVRDCKKCGKTEKLHVADYCTSTYVKFSEKTYNSFMKAAQGGDVNAMLIVARALQCGNGIERNIDEAILWYKKAIDKDDFYACYCLGTLYMGMRNYNLAEEFFNKALNINKDKNIVQDESFIRDKLNVVIELKQKLEKEIKRGDIGSVVKALAAIIGSALFVGFLLWLLF